MLDKLISSASDHIIAFLTRPRGIISFKVFGLGLIGGGAAFDSFRGFAIKAEAQPQSTTYRLEIFRDDMVGVFFVVVAMLVLFVIVDAVLIAQERRLQSNLALFGPPTTPTKPDPVVVILVDDLESASVDQAKWQAVAKIIGDGLPYPVKRVPKIVFRRRNPPGP